MPCPRRCSINTEKDFTHTFQVPVPEIQEQVHAVRGTGRGCPWKEGVRGLGEATGGGSGVTLCSCSPVLATRQVTVGKSKALCMF